jgi:5-methylcytosine-specific restriction enzyme A
MLDNYYVYKKEVDWSLLHQGISIPLNIQVVFHSNIKRFIQRGESKEIFLVIEGETYKAKLVNQNFNETKYSVHKDILQIRYNTQSEIAIKLRSNFITSYRYLSEKRNSQEEKQRKYIKIPEEKKEYLAVYTTEYEDTYLIECITENENSIAKSIFLRESEQEYETALNYNVIDPNATIQTVQQMTKIRKLNKAIGENLKMLYDYKCQLCGENFGRKFEANIVEAHHLDPFVVSLNNDSSNQIIICPNHHRVMHKVEPVLDKTKLLFLFSNGIEERILINRHL